MTRTLFFFTALVGMLMAVSAILIRVELAYPGLSGLFNGLDDAQDGRHFAAVAQSHTVFGYLAVTLLGATMAAAARTRQATLGTPTMVVGLCIAGVLALVLLLGEIPADLLTGSDTAPADILGSGWTFYGPNQSILDLALGWVGIDPLLLPGLTRVLTIPALFILLLGAYALLSTEPGLRLVGIGGGLIALIVVCTSAAAVMNVNVMMGNALYLLAILPFVIGASVRLVDESPSWLLMLMIGVLVMAAAHIGLTLLPNPSRFDGTQAAAVLGYLFPLGIGWYGLPALMLYTHPTRLPDLAIWVLSGIITLGLAIWTVPMFSVGANGQPLAYVDFPDTFAARNLAASTGVVLFTMIYLGVIVIIRRGRA